MLARIMPADPPGPWLAGGQGVSVVPARVLIWGLLSGANRARLSERRYQRTRCRKAAFGLS